jgi:hypothetical protein
MLPSAILGRTERSQILSPAVSAELLEKALQLLLQLYPSPHLKACGSARGQPVTPLIGKALHSRGLRCSHFIRSPPHLSAPAIRDVRQRPRPSSRRAEAPHRDTPPLAARVIHLSINTSSASGREPLEQHRTSSSSTRH